MNIIKDSINFTIYLLLAFVLNAFFFFDLEITPIDIKPIYFIFEFYQENKSILFQYSAYSIIYLAITKFIGFKIKNPKMRKLKKSGDLNKLSWREFEVLTQEFYQSRGYKAKVIGGSGGDGGIDVLLKKGGKKYIVQCKHWKNARVGVKVVRELFGVMLHEKADGVKIIATAGFTKECYNFTKGKKIELIDGKKLLSML